MYRVGAHGEVRAELANWQGHAPEAVRAMKEGLARLEAARVEPDGGRGRGGSGPGGAGRACGPTETSVKLAGWTCTTSRADDDGDVRARRRSAARLLAVAPVFAALGDETRLRLVDRLSHQGPIPIVELTEDTGMTRQAVSKHLTALEDAGLLRSTRVGRQRIWELQPEGLDVVARHLQAISRQWDAAIERLRAFVED